MAFQGRTRAVLTAVLALLGYYGVVLALAVPVLLVLPGAWTEGTIGIGVMSFPLIGAALVVNWVLVWRGWSSWRTLGWDVDGRAGAMSAATGGGLLLAFLALAVVAIGGGGVVMTGEAASRYAEWAAVVGGVLLMAALSEELLFRGYPLVRLSKATGRVAASAALAAVFALVHFANPERSTLGLANIGLASLLLSAAFFTRGGLWAAWGMHFGWNAGLALAADAPVSGYPLELPMLEYVAGPRHWVSGGAFGPEGGVAATVALGLGLWGVITIVRREQRRSEA